MSERPKDERRDHPLTCNWRPISPEAFDALDLPAMRQKIATITRSQILTEAIVVGRADPDGFISYSRNKNFYADLPPRYRPTSYTYSSVVSSIDQLAGLGLLEHQRAPQGNLGWQSRFKASTALLNAMNSAPLAVIHDPRELIVMRDSDGNLMDYRDSRRAELMRRKLAEINEAITSVAIGLRDQVTDGGPIQFKDGPGAAESKLHRVFNRGSFSLGGRFYGPWWQNIPSKSRAGIEIDGSRTVEIDYRALHPAMLYMQAGKQMEGDPYDLVGWPRPLVKVALLILVNADNRTSAIRAIANEIRGEGAHAKATALVADIEAKHQPIAHMFGSGAGLALQRQESDMTEALLLKLMARGVVALPVHDSCIVPETAKGELMEAMAAELHNSGQKTSAIAGSYPKYDLQYGNSGGAPVVEWLVGHVVVFFPDLPQRDFFGSHSMSISAAAVFEWRGGIAPVPVRKALRHEIKRRGHRHAEVAARAGISRPHFENILQGTFGASPEVADRIRNFLVEGAATVGGGRRGEEGLSTNRDVRTFQV